jgi:hypothetical protein
LEPDIAIAKKWKDRAAAKGYKQYNNEANTFYRLDIPLPPNMLKPTKTLSDDEIAKNLQAGIKEYEQKRYKKARDYLQLPAELGNVDAQYYLGLAYRDDRSKTRGCKWFKHAANQGHTKSKMHYGYCLEVGDVIPQDYKKALKLYKEAAREENITAYFRLGQMYEHGYGVPVNLERAVAFYKFTADRGMKSGRQAINIMENLGKTIPDVDTSKVISKVLGIHIEIKNPSKVTKACRKLAESRITWCWKLFLGCDNELGFSCDYRVECKSLTSNCDVPKISKSDKGYYCDTQNPNNTHHDKEALIEKLCLDGY